MHCCLHGLQEAGLEQQKEAASSLLHKAKAAEATVAEGERKAEAARLVNSVTSTHIIQVFHRCFGASTGYMSVPLSLSGPASCLFVLPN